MTGATQQDRFNEISRYKWQYLSDVYYFKGFKELKVEAKILNLHPEHLVNKIKQFNKELTDDRNNNSELDIFKELSFTERLQLELNYRKNYLEFNDNNTTLAE